MNPLDYGFSDVLDILGNILEKTVKISHFKNFRSSTEKQSLLFCRTKTIPFESKMSLKLEA